MKKTIARISTVLLLLVVSIASVTAQPRRHHRRSYSGDGIIRGIRNVETVAGAAMMGASIASLDDYTGIRFGYNAATLRTSGFDGINSDVKSGVNVGVVFGWYLGNTPVIIEPGVYYTLKGGKFSDKYSDGTDIKTNMHMFEIPLVFKYEVQFHNAGVCIHPFFGGFLAFGIGGNVKVSDYYENDKWSDSTFGDGRAGLHRTDAGLRMGCGLGVDHFFIELAYDLGLVNLASDDYYYYNYDSFDDGIYSNTVSFSLGFNF